MSTALSRHEKGMLVCVYEVIYFIVVITGEQDKRNRHFATVSSCVRCCRELASVFKSQSASHQSQLKPAT